VLYLFPLHLEGEMEVSAARYDITPETKRRRNPTPFSSSANTDPSRDANDFLGKNSCKVRVSAPNVSGALYCMYRTGLADLAIFR
jgi:hypothetical protein